MQRISIETAASLLGISPRLLRMPIEKKIAPIRLLGGPGPKAVALDQVLAYNDVMPPTKSTKRTAVDSLADTLSETRAKITRS